MNTLLALFKFFIVLPICLSFSNFDGMLINGFDLKNTRYESSKGRFVIAKLIDNNPELLINKETLKVKLISNKIFADVESIDVDCIKNDKGEVKSYLTVIGKDLKDFSLQAFVADLTLKNNQFYLSDKRLAKNPYYMHTCKNADAIYKSCEFDKDEYMKIIGCAKFDKNEKLLNCNHSIAMGSDAISTIVQLVYESI